MAAQAFTMAQKRGRSVARSRFAIFLILLFFCFLGGGGSRNDILSLLYLQPAAAFLLALMLALPAPVNVGLVRAPLMILGALAAIMVLQLVPLPPTLWMDLPGHARFAEAAAAAGMSQPWRPISITPDQTLASLAGLVVPAALLVGYACLEPPQRRATLHFLLAAVFLGCFLGIAQIVGGGDSWAYQYRVTNPGSAVGWFANRNHQATLLATTYPMLAVWATMPGENRQRSNSRIAIAATFAIFLVPMILVTGSRAGLFLTIVAIVGTYLAFRHRLARIVPVAKRHSRILLILLVAIAIALAAAAVMLSRAQAWDRLLVEPQIDSVRVGNLPVYFRMIGDFFPAGSGFGSFEALFKAYEPFPSLAPKYVNHAHNDLLELLITGSLPAMMVLLAGLWWLTRAGFIAYQAQPQTLEREVAVGFAKAGALVIGIFLLASLSDYPLRTPLAASIFMLGGAWLSDGTRNEFALRRRAS